VLSGPEAGDPVPLLTPATSLSGQLRARCAACGSPGASIHRSATGVRRGATRRRAGGFAAERRGPNGVVNQIATVSLRHVPFTQLANLTGTPAIALPLH
jgi:hypothetical protein